MDTKNEGITNLHKKAGYLVKDSGLYFVVIDTSYYPTR